jgi:hypothetical protein
MLTSGFIALTLSQQAASILHRLIEAISWLFVTVRIVEFTQDVTTLEKHMRTFAYTTSKTTRGLPGNGMHFLPVFAAVCYKTTVCIRVQRFKVPALLQCVYPATKVPGQQI